MVDNRTRNKILKMDKKLAAGKYNLSYRDYNSKSDEFKEFEVGYEKLEDEVTNVTTGRRFFNPISLILFALLFAYIMYALGVNNDAVGDNFNNIVALGFIGIMVISGAGITYQIYLMMFGKIDKYNNEKEKYFKMKDELDELKELMELYKLVSTRIVYATNIDERDMVKKDRNPMAFNRVDSNIEYVQVEKTPEEIALEEEEEQLE